MKKKSSKTSPVKDFFGIERQYSKDKSKCTINFRVSAEFAAGASSIAVVGSFNNWNEKSHLLSKDENGDFCLDVEVETGHQYEFKFIVDESQWVNALNADSYVWSEYGNCDNSVIYT